MRILHTESSLTLGGRELAVLEVCQGLLKRGHEVVLAVQAQSRLLELATRRGVPRQTISMSKLAYPFAVQAFRSLIDHYAIEVIHTHSSRDRWMAAIAAKLCASHPIVVCARHHCGTIRPVGDKPNPLPGAELCHCDDRW